MIRFVAGRIFSVLDVDRVVGHLLDAAAHQPAVALLRRHALDLGLLRFEVVGDRVHLVGGFAAVGEFGFGDDGLAFERVGFAVCVDQLGVHVDLHVVGFEVAVLIGDVAFVVDVDHLVADVVNQRVLVLARNRIVEEGAGLARPLDRVAGHGVGLPAGQRVGPAGDERIDLRTEHRVALLLRHGFEFGVAAGFLAGGPCLRAAFAACAGGFGNFGRGFRKGICRNGIVGAGAVRGGCGEHAPGCGRAEHQLGEEQDQRRRKQIFYPKFIQNSNNFSYLCRHVGKNA